MRQRLGILFGSILLAVILIGLNAATYVQREKTPDSEYSPNRSTFNSGATGTQAFYTLLSETGRKVTRWQSPISDLKRGRNGGPATFVIIGATRRPITESESTLILNWVKGGGHLVVVDRILPESIATAAKDWNITAEPKGLEFLFGTDPADRAQMISDTPAAKPVQPGAYVFGVNAVQVSRFASDLNVSWDPSSTAGDKMVADGPPSENESGPTAPVIHFASTDRSILADFVYGFGRITILSDPFVLSNAGVALVDNAQLGINIVESRGGIVAFDEYHQGFGADQNRFFQFFAGTPIMAIFLQVAVIIGFVFYSQSRRFARPVPDEVLDRLTKLEYVSAMAELQQRTRAYDLAIENIYADFRRRASRLLGVDNRKTGRKLLAKLIAERAKADENEIEELMFKCEDVVHGEPTNTKAVVSLVERIRDLESRLGISRSGGKKAVK